MDIVLLKNATPLYEQIYANIMAQIMNGTLTADECLPSIRAISRELGISIITVKKAYEQLEERGFIYTLAGKGCFVASMRDKLTGKRNELAYEKLSESVEYCNSLGLSEKEVVDFVKKIYER